MGTTSVAAVSTAEGNQERSFSRQTKPELQNEANYRGDLANDLLQADRGQPSATPAKAPVRLRKKANSVPAAMPFAMGLRPKP